MSEKRQKEPYYGTFENNENDPVVVFIHLARQVGLSHHREAHGNNVKDLRSSKPHPNDQWYLRNNGQ